MNKYFGLALTALLISTATQAQTDPAGGAPAPGSCEAKAVSKDGKPLYGAAKDASIKKCMKDNPPPATGDGKTAQQEKMKKCNAEAAGKKSDERKQFMSTCLSN